MKKLFTLLSLFFCLNSLLFGQHASEIRMNQLGFYPEGEKLAAVITPNAASFVVKSTLNDEEVFSGTLGASQHWDKSDEQVSIADFTELDAPGIYYLEVEGIGRSHDFMVSERAYLGTARAAMKAYYFNRASTELTEEYAGPWARPEGHPDDQVRVHASAATEERPTNTIISAPKGWYDAGDYNKYIVNSGISVYTLLSAYQHYPAFFNELNTNIPESDNAVPDILDEVMWNLEWMLDMQDPNDGGVYHKLTTEGFSGAVMPHRATAMRFVVQKSTAATLNFAAVMAQSYRVFLEIDPDFAQRALEAAISAYAWAEENPAVYYRQGQMNNQYNPDIHTGEYGDGNVTDEFNWAATELYLSTMDESYFGQVNINYSGGVGAPGWNYVTPLSLMSLVYHEDELTGAAAEQIDNIKGALLNTANGYLSRKEGAPYRVSINDFYWGSNSLAANQGMILLAAFRVSDNEDYLLAANAALDYLLGRNATEFSFVTGLGHKPSMNIHHRQSEADNVVEPVPGFLAGGPQPGQQDGCTYPSDLPAKSYSDTWCSYASNEVTINWNAPLVFLAAGLEHHYEQSGFAGLNQGPAAPNSISAEISGENNVDLRWASTSSELERHIIERAEGEDGSFEEIAEVRGASFRYTDEGLSRGKTYFYRIKSGNAFGESDPSESVFVTIEGEEDEETPTGLFDAEQGTAKAFELFPNPAQGKLNFKLDPAIKQQSCLVKIIDLQGHIVKQYSLQPDANEFSIETAQLKGFYILQLSTGKYLYAPQKIMLK